MSLDILRNGLRKFLMKFSPCWFHWVRLIAKKKRFFRFIQFHDMVWKSSINCRYLFLMKLNDRIIILVTWLFCIHVSNYQVPTPTPIPTPPFKLNIFIKNALRKKGYFTVNYNFSRNQKPWQRANVLLVTSYYLLVNHY